MHLLISVRGLFSGRIRRESALQNTEEKHKRETDLKPSIITTRAFRETQFVHAEAFPLSSPTRMKTALRLGTKQQLCYLYAFYPPDRWN